MTVLWLLSTSITRLAVICVALMAIAACGEAVTASSEAGARADDSASPREGPIDGATPPPPPFTLYVSNQSFEDPNVQITIAIDGVVVVDQSFAVEGQHNWSTFEPDVLPGEHILTAASNTGAELSVEFTTNAGQPRWAVVDYWWHHEDGPRKFTFHISDEPIGFA
jgi:hypothetical protein